MKKKLYIGCALTNLPPLKKDKFLGAIKKIRKELGKHFKVIEFLGIIGPSTGSGAPKKVYNHDIKKCVMKADCMLAICDYPSLGLGYEIATAVEKRGVPVLAMAHKDSRVTNLVMGVQHKNFTFLRYSSVDEIVAKTIETLTN